MHATETTRRIAELDGGVVRRCRVQEHRLADNRTLLRIELLLEDGVSLTVSCAADGRSLRLDEQTPALGAMGRYGELTVHEGHPICGVLQPGSRIALARPLVDTEGLTIGVHLLTEAGRSVYIVNWGDTLIAPEDLPPHVAAALQPTWPSQPRRPTPR